LKIQVAFIDYKTVEFNLAFEIFNCKNDKEVARAITSIVCVYANYEKLVKALEGFLNK